MLADVGLDLDNQSLFGLAGSQAIASIEDEIGLVQLTGRDRSRPLVRAAYLQIHRARVQGVVATLAGVDRSTSSKASAGVLQPRVFRGLALSAAATAASASALCVLRSVPLGKYCRSSPLVFSFVPRCHGLCGSQK